MKTGFCVVIPVYNHPDTIADTVAEVRSAGYPVILVDDGSGPVCASILDRLTEGDETVHLRRLQVNGGKGRAVKSGLLMARELGFTHALQIDADGQHDPQDIPRLVRLARQHPDAIISGMPAYDDSVPRVRYYSRYLTHVWVWINTLSLEIRDSMCGFRAYPLQLVCKLVGREHLGDRMDFDTEILVRWVWRGGRVFQFPTRVRYPRDGISHFRGFEDNWLITRMHTRLFFGMLWRLPRLLAGRLRRREVSS